MTFAPMRQVAATITALEAHGVLLPQVPTKIVVPYSDKVYINLDVSGLSEAAQNTVRYSIPASFTRMDFGRGDDPFWVGHLQLLTTEVSFRLYETDQDFSA